MAREKKKEPVHSMLNTDKPIKVRLDERTVITIRGKKALKFWRESYPKLQIIG